MTNPTPTNTLRELAEAATPGPWALDSDVTDSGLVDPKQVRYFDQTHKSWSNLVYCHWSPKDAAYIAAANPARILALMDERDKLADQNTSLRNQLSEVTAREDGQHNDIGILIAIINGLEEATGEGPEDEDAVLFSQITAGHNEAIERRKAAQLIQSKEGA